MAAKQERLGSPALQEPLFSICQKPDFLGLPAKEFLLEVLRFQAEIEKIALVVYDWQSESRGPKRQAFTSQNICWVERDQIAPILTGNRYEVLEMLLGREAAEAGRLTPAIGSLVIRRGKLAHLYQMDFIYRSTDDNDLLNGVSYFLGPGRWVIVDSGLLYHAWGVHGLASMAEWRGFMERVKRKCDFTSAKDGLVPDEGFITASLKRGFSALRVHEIPFAEAIEGEFPPKIIGLVDSMV